MAIAQALLTRPGALVLDCPLDGLDTAAVNQLAEVLDAYPGEVTVYDRRPSAVSEAAVQQFQLSDGELRERPIPEFDLPNFPPRNDDGAAPEACRAVRPGRPGPWPGAVYGGRPGWPGHPHRRAQWLRQDP